MVHGTLAERPSGVKKNKEWHALTVGISSLFRHGNSRKQIYVTLRRLGGQYNYQSYPS